MNAKKLLTLFLGVVLLFYMGCAEEEDCPTCPEEQVLATLNDYLVENDLDLPDILTEWIITAKDVSENLDDYYVIDSRSADAYAAGHIPGAVNADATTLLDVAADNGGKTIVVHCYKGIGATRLVTALRLSGYPTAKSMKFGMSAWGLADADSTVVLYDKWTGATSDTALFYPNDWLLTATDPAADVEYDYPAIATTETDAELLLQDRVAYLLEHGYGYASAPGILIDREDYFINNYWDETSWTTYGHIAGAHRVYDDGILSIELGGIKYMDPDEEVVTYCWTSQTSGMITAYLTVLGYNAKSLLIGANGMIWSNLTAHNWDSENGTPGENAPGNYELEQSE